MTELLPTFSKKITFYSVQNRIWTAKLNTNKKAFHKDVYCSFSGSGGVCTYFGGTHPLGTTSPGPHPLRTAPQRTTPPKDHLLGTTPPLQTNTCGQTYTCENITWPQTSFAGGNKVTKIETEQQDFKEDHCQKRSCTLQ